MTHKPDSGSQTQHTDVCGSQTPECDPQAHGWLIHKAGKGWYRPDAQGYTNDTAYAGRYSHKDAVRHSFPNGRNGPRDGISIKHESELPHPRAADPVAALIEAQSAQIATLQAKVERLQSALQETARLGYEQIRNRPARVEGRKGEAE